jgi:hypothetical protein
MTPYSEEEDMRISIFINYYWKWWCLLWCGGGGACGRVVAVVMAEIQAQRATCQEILDDMGTLYTTRME